MIRLDLDIFNQIDGFLGQQDGSVPTPLEWPTVHWVNKLRSPSSCGICKFLADRGK